MSWSKMYIVQKEIINEFKGVFCNATVKKPVFNKKKRQDLKHKIHIKNNNYFFK